MIRPGQEEIATVGYPQSPRVPRIMGRDKKRGRVIERGREGYRGREKVSIGRPRERRE